MKISYFYLFIFILFELSLTLSHAQILEGLKDAVLNAEGIVSDIFKSLDSVSKQFKFGKEFFKDSVEEHCKYTCPDGTTPKKNKYHEPKPNGCGVPNVEITETGFLPRKEMNKCCDQHDVCYGTCNRDKDECDLSFKRCLYSLCESSKEKSSETFSTGCKASAKTLYSGTMMFGCKFYKIAQEEACYCPPKSRKVAGDEF